MIKYMSVTPIFYYRFGWINIPDNEDGIFFHSLFRNGFDVKNKGNIFSIISF